MLCIAPREDMGLGAADLIDLASQAQAQLRHVTELNLNGTPAHARAVFALVVVLRSLMVMHVGERRRERVDRLHGRRVSACRFARSPGAAACVPAAWRFVFRVCGATGARLGARRLTRACDVRARKRADCARRRLRPLLEQRQLFVKRRWTSACRRDRPAVALAVFEFCR